MKTNALSLLAIAGLLSFAGCASDDTENKDNEQDPGSDGLTAFVVEDNGAQTRTSAEYDGSGLNFYWTAGDRLWVNNTAASPALKQDASNNITGKSATARFWFDGTYTATSYPVRYTGKNGASNKVTIKAAQSQTVPNDASHIGEDGDCGTSTATKPTGSEAYGFTLNHEAAYATFLPYNSNRLVADFVIQKITMIADQALCGTFDFNDNGIDTGSRPAPTTTNRIIELTLNDFAIPATATPTTNAATAVIAPGNYTNFTVVYTLHNPTTNQTGTVTKQYPGTVTFTKGKNKKISQNLLTSTYSNDGYYMWDAQQSYWYGHLDANGNIDNQNNYPHSKAADPDRWYNDMQGYSDPTGIAPAELPSTAHFQVLPNANEIGWYIQGGDPHWDDTLELWAFMGHLYKGGMWLKKKAYISGYTAEHAPNGTDYTKSTSSFDYVYENNSITQGKPAASILSNYFYLPALGYYSGYTHYEFGSSGYYWSSTPYPQNSALAYDLVFNRHVITGDSNSRDYGNPLWRAE